MARNRETALDVMEKHIGERVGAGDKPAVVTPGFLTYRPSWVAENFHKDVDTRVRGLMGPIGCGKSHACVMEMFFMARRAPIDKDGWRKSIFIAVRRTYQQLQDTTERLFFQIFPPNNSGSITTFLKNDHHATLRYRDAKTDEKIELQVIFRAMASDADGSKILSINASAAWMNEWDQIPRACHQQVQQRLGRYPQVADLAHGEKPHPAAMIMDYNAPSPDSWYYSFFEEETAGWKRLYKYPSGISDKACNLEYLADGYYETSFGGAEEMYIRRYRDNEYVNLTNKDVVFTSYHDDTHTIEDVRYDPTAELHVGLDFGRSPAAVFCQRDSMGRWVVLDEMVMEKGDATTFAPLLRDFINDIGVPFRQPRITGDPSGMYGNEVNSLLTVYDILANYELHASPAMSNSLDLRLGVVMTCLNELVSGRARLRVARRCKWLRRAMADGYHYNEMGKPVKNEFSHVVDALGYCLIGAGEAGMLARRRTGRYSTMGEGGPLRKHNFGRPMPLG